MPCSGHTNPEPIIVGDAVVRAVAAAGGVVTRADPHGRRVLVVHRPNYDDWSLPKGKVDPGETWAMAAVREVREETGVRARICARVAQTEYEDRRGRNKTVQYFTMAVDDDPAGRIPDDEVDIVDWWAYDDAVLRLTYPRDRAMLADACLDRVEVLVVRHADAGVRGVERDDVRTLSMRGEAQAAALVERLVPYRVGTIVSSAATRCRQTVEPYARATDHDLVVDERLAEGAGPTGLIALIEQATTPIVLCSHGDVIGDALGLMARRGIELDGDGLAKAGIWSLTVERGTVVHGEYWPPT